MSSICIIPARGGSKRIPKKNIRHFLGLPIIQRSINSALASNCFTDVIVSTDDPEIASIALSSGASVPFIRPTSISDDFTGTNAVIQHAITTLNLIQENVQHVCCLYATAPFLVPEDFIEIKRLFLRYHCKHPAFTACAYSSPIQRSFNLDKSGLSVPFDITSYEKRSQDLIKYFFDAGQLYIASPLQWMNDPIFTSNAIPYCLDSWRVQDIDTLDDWLKAELLYKVLQQSKFETT